MIQRAARTGRPPPRPSRLELARKTNLVPRAGFWSRGAGFALRTQAARAGAFLWRTAGFLVAALAVDLQVAGGLADPMGLTWIELLALALLGGVFVHRLARRVVGPDRAEGSPARKLEADLELATVAIVASRVAIGFGGGLGSPFEPFVYLAVVLIVVFHGAAVGAYAVGGAVGLETLLAWADGALATSWDRLAAHAGFVVVFGALYHLALKGSVLAGRSQTRAAIAAHVRDLHQRAREYRLVVSHDASGAPTDAMEKWVTAAVGEVEVALQAVLEIAQTALQTHTVAVFMLSPDDRQLRLGECKSDSDHVTTRPLAAGEGLPGVVLRRRAAVRLCGAFRGAVYYTGGEAPRAFLGVPLVEPGPDGGFVRGVLVADRLEERPFEDADEKLLTILGREVLRAMVVERVMGYIRKEKDEQERFHRALEELNALSKPKEIFEQIVAQARDVAGLDFVAVTLAEGEGASRHHRIVQAVGEGAEALEGQAFDENAGLVSQVVRVGHRLPPREFSPSDRQAVFTPDLKVRGVSTLKVLPLRVGTDDPFGTLVCGATRKHGLTSEALNMLDALCMMAGQSIARARLFEQTERMATTDGLTGLNNHRRFQELFDQVLAQARRYGRPVSMLLTDVDHFKSVNDTYGHPVGDIVLKGVARVLATSARDTDIVARYGGEEFAVILPETDLEGALTIANRIRERIAEQVFQSELGTLSVTISIGAASCPNHGDHKQALVDKADQALYAAKRSGRDRVVSADAL